MSLEFETKLKLCFFDSVKIDKKALVYDMFKSILNSDCCKNTLNKASFCVHRLNIHKANGKIGHPYVYVIELERDGWFSTSKLSEIIAKALAMPDSAHTCTDDLPRRFECVESYEQFCADCLSYRRIITGVDGKTLLDEENEVTYKADGTWTYSNPDYGKQDFLDVVAKNFHTMIVYLDVKHMAEAEENTN